ncbi:MAG: sensor histidine kinase, partial [Pseudomonadota bacterium]
PQGGRVRVQIDHSEAAGQLVISVSDDGPGVPLETHEQLTQRFYRGEASRTTPGHGLGLAMVQAIADVHNAQLTFSNGDERHGLKGLKASLEFQS